MIDIKDLEAFLAIIDGGSLSRAADEMGLTQPALSLKLKKMESELGVKLFQRTPRHMVPLEAARALEPKVRDICARFHGVKELLATTIRELHGNIRLGCLLGWFDALLVPTLAALHEKAPLLRMRLHVDETHRLLNLVTHGQLDLAIVAQPFERHDGLSYEHLLDEEIVLVGQQLPKGRQIKERRADLLSRPWITMSIPDPLVDKYWREEFGGEAFPWDRVTVPVCMDQVLAMPRLLMGMPQAVSIMPRQIVVGDAGRGLEIASAVPQRNGLFLVWRAGGLELQRYKVVKDLIVERARGIL